MLILSEKEAYTVSEAFPVRRFILAIMILTAKRIDKLALQGVTEV